MGTIIAVSDLVKRYGDFTAVAGVSFAVEAGECFGLLGPNGAGKSSVLRILTAVSPATAGQVTVAGLDVARRPREVKALLGVAPQGDTLDPDLSTLQNLVSYSRYFRIPEAEARERAREALAFFGLAGWADAQVDTLSGGMQRRLTIARALINRPQAVALDEPTTGLDPSSRHRVWQRLLELRRQGVTIILSTHNMEEAAALCQRLVIMDRGRIIAAGTPAELVAQAGSREVVEVRPALGAMEVVYERLCGEGLRVERAGALLLVYGDGGPVLEQRLAGEGMQAHHRTANLEDVFLRLTGRTLEDEEDA